MTQRFSKRSQNAGREDLVVGGRDYQLRSKFESINTRALDMASEIKKALDMDHLWLSKPKQKKLDSLTSTGEVIRAGGTLALLPDEIAFILELYAASVYLDAKAIRMDAGYDDLRAAAEIYYLHSSASDPAGVEITESDLRLVIRANEWFQQTVQDLYDRGLLERAARREAIRRAMRGMEDVRK